VTIFDLKHGMCRDVTLDPDQPGGFYCGAPVKLGKSYCPDCRKRLFVAARPKIKGYYGTPSQFILKHIGKGIAA
jgi:DNA-directed RNA polymerase subunit RPC12/RpoP